MQRSTMLVFAVLVIIIAGGAAVAVSKKNSENTQTPSSNSTSTTPSSNSTQNMNTDDHKAGSNSGSGNQTQSVDTNNVKIEDFAFRPAAITVKKGTTVTWKNDDDAAHTVTADDGSFGSGTLNHDDTYSFTFNKPGTFKYHCNLHTSMTATVTVTD